MAKLSLADHEQRGREVHGNAYKYLAVLREDGTTYLDLECDRHGEFRQQAYVHTKMKSGCPTCALERTGRSPEHTVESYAAMARKIHGEKFEYLRIERSKIAMYIIFSCPIHGEMRQNSQAHLRAGGCAKCHKDSVGETLEDLIPQFRKMHGDKYKYLEVVRVDSMALVSAVCPTHGELTFRASSHKRGEGCFRCGRESSAEKREMPFDIFEQRALELHKGKYSYKGFESTGKHRSVLIICPDHGEFSQRSDQHLDGKGCSKCRGPISKPNLAIQKFLEDLGISTRLEENIPGTRKSMDVFCPERLLGIEYHGNIWHSTKWIRDRKGHFNRYKEAQVAGIRLIQIFSDEWTYRRQACELILSRASGVPEIAVNARSCEVVAVSHKNASTFFDSWHVQGATSANSHFLGLMDGAELVAVMGFSRNTSARKEKATEGKAELTRYATCKNVRGGFSKLLKAWQRLHPEVTEIVSYSDNRLFLGRMYEACGFKSKAQVPIDYTYLDPRTDKRLHKAKFQKSRLKKLMGSEYDETKTEWELTEKLGYYRIYDCGKTLWVLQ